MNKPKARFEVDRANAVNPQAFVFARQEWTFTGDSPQTLSLDGPPGSWTKPPELLAHGPFEHVFAFVRCPHCHGYTALHDQVHKIGVHDGKLSPDFGHQGCSFRRIAYLDNWNDKKLYAMSFHNRKGDIEIFYSHADNQAEARMHLGGGIRAEDVIAIAPAIGLFVDEAADKTGTVLVTH